MNNHELDRLLKSASAPERPEAYWRDFPKRVTAKLHWRPSASQEIAHPRARFMAVAAWGFALCAACIAIAFIVRIRSTHSMEAVESNRKLAEARKCYRELEALFPNQLRAIVFDEQGPRMVLADKPVVPDSTPFYLNVCGPAGCKGFVTFSGQEIQFDGERCEVLANAQGQLMLVGSRHVWSQNEPMDAVRVNARPLEATL
jgi:hypothetical protein